MSGPDFAQNTLLAALPITDRQLLLPHIRLVDWHLDEVFVVPDGTVGDVWFPVRGFASVVATISAGKSFEVGVYGREGAGPAQVILGQDRSPHRHVVQAPGAAYILPKVELDAAMKRSLSLKRLFMSYVDAFTVQTGHTALSNSKDEVSVRLARWLLMCRDRLDGDDLPLTRAHLRMMLGTTMSSVELSLSVLQAEGAIMAGQDHVQLLNRKRLENRAGGSYGVPEVEYKRLLGA